MSNPTLDDLAKLVLAFREERDWKQFHNPKDMALSLSLEAGEVMELMQWKNGAELEAHLRASKDQLGEELADVLGWILLLAHDQQIDLADAFVKKIALNERKYPVDQARGKSNKYTDYVKRPTPPLRNPAVPE